MSARYGTDLDDVLDTLTELGDEGIDLIVAGFRNIAARRQAGLLDLDDTKLLLAHIAGSPDAADVVGACAFAVADLTNDTAPALTALTDEARKIAIHAGQKAAYDLTHYELRHNPSAACAALDHLEPRP